MKTESSAVCRQGRVQRTRHTVKTPRRPFWIGLRLWICGLKQAALGIGLTTAFVGRALA